MSEVDQQSQHPTEEKISPMCVVGSTLGASVAFPAAIIAVSWLFVKLLNLFGIMEPPYWLVWLHDHTRRSIALLGSVILIALIAQSIYPHCRRRRGR